MSVPHVAHPAVRRRRCAPSEAAERRQRTAALLFVIVLHLLLAIAAYRAVRPHPSDAAPPLGAQTIMHLRLIDTPAATSAVPLPVPAAIATPALPAAASARTAMPAAPAAVAPPASALAPPAAVGGGPALPGWVERDGSVRLPDAVAAPRTFSNRPLREADAPNPLVHRDVLPYTPTRLEGVWAPRDETLGGEVLRRGTAEGKVNLPQGYQVRCVWMLIIGGCGWGKAPQASIDELKAMRADPPMPRSLVERSTAGPAAAATPDAVTPDAAPDAPPRPLDLSLPPPLAIPAPRPGGR